MGIGVSVSCSAVQGRKEGSHYKYYQGAGTDIMMRIFTASLLTLLVVAVAGDSSADSDSSSSSSSRSRSSASSEASERGKQPHILYVLADDLGWNDLSWHDSSMITPHLQRLAEEGVILENLYTMTVCTPTRTALMTGMYPSRTGTQHLVFLPCKHHGLPTDLKTLPQLLQEVGYRTYHVGKWHLGFCNEDYLPNNRGIDKFYGFYKGGIDFYTHISSEFGPYAPGQYNGIDFREDIAGEPSVPINQTVYSSYLFLDKALEYIDDHDKSDPMLLFMALQQPHSPTDVPSEWAELYEDSVSDLVRRNYSGQVTVMDHMVGEIRAKLEQRGMFEDTLVIFHSDHGGDVRFAASNWPYRGNKGSYFEGGIKGAGFIAGKGIKKTGYVNHELYHVTDMFTTLVESVAQGTIDVDYDIDGINIWESLSTGSQSPREEFLIVVDEDIPEDSMVAAVRYRDWKLIEGIPVFADVGPWHFFDWYKPPYHGADVIEGPYVLNTTTWLFNLRDDPFEEHNLADENPVMVSYLHDKLEAYRAISIPPIWTEDDPACDPQLYGGFWSPGFC